jgi:hypothetical protein
MTEETHRDLDSVAVQCMWLRFSHHLEIIEVKIVKSIALQKPKGQYQ